MAIGIITGSGAYSLPRFEGGEPPMVEARWGEPPAPRGPLAGAEVPHTPRHEEGHIRLSNHVTHRANIAALRRLGATGALAGTGRGAGDPSVALGWLVCFDDLHFLANRLPDGSLCTFHQNAGHRERGHWIFDDPYSPALRAALLAGPQGDRGAA